MIPLIIILCCLIFFLGLALGWATGKYGGEWYQLFASSIVLVSILICVELVVAIYRAYMGLDIPAPPALLERSE